MWQAWQWLSQRNTIILIVMIFWILQYQTQELIHADPDGLSAKENIKLSKEWHLKMNLWCCAKQSITVYLEERFSYKSNSKLSKSSRAASLWASPPPPCSPITQHNCNANSVWEQLTFSQFFQVKWDRDICIIVTMERRSSHLCRTIISFSKSVHYRLLHKHRGG